MKCIKTTTGKIIRVDDKKAKKLVETGQGVYCPKHEFKSQQKEAERVDAPKKE